MKSLVDLLKVKLLKGLHGVISSNSRAVFLIVTSSRFDRVGFLVHFMSLSGSQTAHTLYLDRLSRAIVSRHAMLRFHVLFWLTQGTRIKGREMALVWHEKASRTALQTSSVSHTHTLLVQTHNMTTVKEIFLQYL